MEGKALRTDLIEETARREWADPKSLSSRNHRSIPQHARSGFAVVADMGGVCMLDPSGKFRVFLHQRQEEMEVTEQTVRGAMTYVERNWPHLLANGDSAD
jgi:hypothetical protein